MLSKKVEENYKLLNRFEIIENKYSHFNELKVVRVIKQIALQSILLF